MITLKAGDWVVPAKGQENDRNVRGRTYPAQILGLVDLWGEQGYRFAEENVNHSPVAKARRFQPAPCPSQSLEDFL